MGRHPLQPQRSSGSSNSRYDGLPQVHLSLHHTHARCATLYLQDLTPTPHNYPIIFAEPPQRETLVRVFLRSACVFRFVLWPERNLIHCIVTSVEITINHFSALAIALPQKSWTLFDQVMGQGHEETRTRTLVQLLSSSAVYKNLWVSSGSNPECTTVQYGTDVAQDEVLLGTTAIPPPLVA